MKRLALAFLLTLLSVTTTASSTVWGVASEVQWIYVNTNGSSPYVELRQPNSMPGCYRNKGGYLKGTDAEAAYSTLLSAKMSKSKIKVGYTVNASGTGWNKCTITSFYLY